MHAGATEVLKYYTFVLTPVVYTLAKVRSRNDSHMDTHPIYWVDFSHFTAQQNSFKKSFVKDHRNRNYFQYSVIVVKRTCRFLHN